MWLGLMNQFIHMTYSDVLINYDCVIRITWWFNLCFRLLSQKISTLIKTRSINRISAMMNMRINVLGARGVGKSAIAVRYLTKRFIGEYSSGLGESTLKFDSIYLDRSVLSSILWFFLLDLCAPEWESCVRNQEPRRLVVIGCLSSPVNDILICWVFFPMTNVQSDNGS